jgi:hypothetical protein
MPNGAAPRKTWRVELRHWVQPPNTPQAYEDAALKEMGKFGPTARDTFREYAPVKTGQLKAKLTYRRDKGGKVMEMTMPWYGRITIEGYAATRVPRKAKAMTITDAGGAVVAFAKRAGPIAPNPWNLKAEVKLRGQMRELAGRMAEQMAKLLKRRNR